MSGSCRFEGGVGIGVDAAGRSVSLNRRGRRAVRWTVDFGGSVMYTLNCWFGDGFVRPTEVLAV